jgi:hypothetical protein
MVKVRMLWERTGEPVVPLVLRGAGDDQIDTMRLERSSDVWDELRAFAWLEVPDPSHVGARPREGLRRRIHDVGDVPLEWDAVERHPSDEIRAL